MGTLNPTIDIHEPLTGKGSGSGHPPTSNGGGDGNGGNGAPDYFHRLRRARLGMMVAMVGIIMIFVSLTSAYIVRQGVPSLDPRTNQMVRDWIPINLPTGLLLVNTFLLLISSLTMEFARRQVTRKAALAPVESIPGVTIGKEKNFPWIAPTILLGFAFLAGQWMAWQELRNRGFFMATNPSSSFAYLLTATHAVHLIGGIIALFYAGRISMSQKSPDQQRIVIDVTAWYWHFMAFLWIYIFALLVFMQ
jgi:cytochrome c oxidase subunit III